MSLSVYLYFDGQCRAAFDHYKSVFDAEEVCCQLFSDGPKEMFGDEPADRIMHTTLNIGESVLMGSDRTTSFDEPLVASKSFSIAYKPESPAEADRIFPLLAEGGEITMPLQQTFWGSYYGMCTDRFGVNWMFNCPL